MRSICLLLLLCPLYQDPAYSATRALGDSVATTPGVTVSVPTGTRLRAVLALGSTLEMAPCLEVLQVQIGLTYPATVQYLGAEGAPNVSAAVLQAGRALTLTFKPADPTQPLNDLGSVLFKAYSPGTGGLVAITTARVTYTDGTTQDILQEAVNPDRLDVTRAKALFVLRLTPVQ